MTRTVRHLSYDDMTEFQRIGAEAFGGSPGDVPAREKWEQQPGRSWGAYDDGVLAGQMHNDDVTSWFHGILVPTLAVGSVAIEPERRGDGLIRSMFDVVLADARERGTAISTLFPSAPGIYRGLGYEVMGSIDRVEVPLERLARTAPPSSDITTRRATTADADAIAAIHTTWAEGQNGPLSRREPPFRREPQKLLESFTGITLAVDGAGDPVGFTAWRRGTGWDPADTVMHVDDLHALTPDAARALWRTLATFSTVVGTARIRTSGTGAGIDPAWLVLPDLTLRRVQEHPYMLRILDVERALAGARLAPVAGTVPFAVADDGPRADLRGAWTIEVHDGAARVQRDDIDVAGAHHDRPTLTANGLALLYSGAQSARNLRVAGHLTGPETWDGALTAMFAGRQVHVRDDF